MVDYGIGSDGFLDGLVIFPKTLQSLGSFLYLNYGFLMTPIILSGSPPKINKSYLSSVIRSITGH
jgi:hypothetical protein